MKDPKIYLIHIFYAEQFVIVRSISQQLVV
jgi:hypothetical protein